MQNLFVDGVEYLFVDVMEGSVANKIEALLETAVFDFNSNPTFCLWW